MSALAAPTARRRLDRPTYVWGGIGLEIFVAIMAIPVGLVMIIDPNGSPLGIPHERIADSPFGSYLVPGVFLFGVNGIGELSAAALAVRRQWLAPWLMGGLGVTLMTWIAIQCRSAPTQWALRSVFQPSRIVRGFRLAGL